MRLRVTGMGQKPKKSMGQKPKKKRKLPKDVRELDTETVAEKLFGKRAAKQLRNIVQDNDLRKAKSG